MNLFADTNKFGLVYFIWDIAQKMNFFIKDFYSKCDLVKLRIWSHLLKKSLMENFIFCTLRVVHQNDPKWWKTYMRTSVCLQRYFKNSFICIYLFIYLFILTQMCTKRLVKMCAKYWEILLTSFWFMDFASNWRNLGQSIYERLYP